MIRSTLAFHGLRSCKWALLSFFGTATLCLPQIRYARLQGPTVTDAQDAAVVGATVTVTNIGTGRELLWPTTRLASIRCRPSTRPLSRDQLHQNGPFRKTGTRT